MSSVHTVQVAIFCCSECGDDAMLQRQSGENVVISGETGVGR